MEPFVYDFDAQFQKYLNQWLKAHQDEYPDFDRLEDALVDVYEDWAETPAKWLNGVQPNAYFAGFEDAGELVKMMERYLNAGVSIPNMLLDEVSARGKAAEEGLMRLVQRQFFLLKDAPMQQEAFVTAVKLLNEIESIRPLQLYVEEIARNGDDEVCEAMAESLTAMGEMVKQPIFDRVAATVSDAALSWYITVLMELQPDPNTYALLLQAFESDSERTATYASFLGKYGEGKAVSVIKERMQTGELNYLEWLECRNAVEALGGVINFDMPDFEGDTYYESLKDLS